MANDILEKLQKLNVNLEDLPQPGGSYVAVNIRKDIAYVAIQFPIKDKEFLYQGRLGKELSTAEGYQASRLAAINILKQVNKFISFDRVLGLNHLDIYYQAFGDWDEAPLVANGASDLFLEILGEKGQHTRGLFGVERLSKKFSVGICSSFTLINK